MESEYVAISMAMKELLPLQRIVLEICHNLKVDLDKIATIKSELWEDNAGALALAKLEPPRMTPRSKHYALKYHWFREFVRLGKVGLNKISTDFQLADILTKSLSRDKFQTQRKMLMGW